MINWKFIGELEGESVLQGYVPEKYNSQSGVTIATGVDLGQWSETTAASYSLPDALAKKLRPYIGLRQLRAAVALAKLPLTVTQDEADMLDEADRAPVVDAIVRNYAFASGTRNFYALPNSVQTVIASVAFQYGPALSSRCPRFWATAIKADWPGMIAELRHFGDRYPTRRNKEADYLRNSLIVGT